MEELKPELLPCPFCGGKAYYTESVNGNLMVYVGCSPCGVHVKAQRQDHGRPVKLTKDIVAVWNTRDESQLTALKNRNAELEAEVERLKDVVQDQNDNLRVARGGFSDPLGILGEPR